MYEPHDEDAYQSAPRRTGSSDNTWWDRPLTWADWKAGTRRVAIAVALLLFAKLVHESQQRNSLLIEANCRSRDTMVSLDAQTRSVDQLKLSVDRAEVVFIDLATAMRKTMFQQARSQNPWLLCDADWDDWYSVTPGGDRHEYHLLVDAFYEQPEASVAELELAEDFDQPE